MWQFAGKFPQKKTILINLHKEKKYFLIFELGDLIFDKNTPLIFSAGVILSRIQYDV